jgi:hypothetical protein
MNLTLNYKNIIDEAEMQEDDSSKTTSGDVPTTRQSEREKRKEIQTNKEQLIKQYGG